MSQKATLIAMLAGAALFTSLTMTTASADEHALRYAPSELDSIAGAQHVYSEIISAAEDICSDRYGGHRLVRYRAQYERCIIEVTDDLVRRVDAPLLYEVHLQAAW